MTDLLHQININYHPNEDRLLMRTTTRGGEEYRVWLTRRFTGMLNNLLLKSMDMYGGAPTVGAAPKTQQMFKSGAFEKKFDKDKSSDFPLGEKGILAYGVKSSVTNEGIMHLEILPEKGKGLTLNMDKTLIYMLHNLLSQGIAQAEWKIEDAQKSGSSKVH